MAAHRRRPRQRADLLEAVAADLYGPNRLVQDGHLPAALSRPTPNGCARWSATGRGGPLPAFRSPSRSAAAPTAPGGCSATAPRRPRAPASRSRTASPPPRLRRVLRRGQRAPPRRLLPPLPRRAARDPRRDRQPRRDPDPGPPQRDLFRARLHRPLPRHDAARGRGPRVSRTAASWSAPSPASRPSRCSGAGSTRLRRPARARRLGRASARRASVRRCARAPSPWSTRSARACSRPAPSSPSCRASPARCSARSSCCPTSRPGGAARRSERAHVRAILDAMMIGPALSTACPSTPTRPPCSAAPSAARPAIQRRRLARGRGREPGRPGGGHPLDHAGLDSTARSRPGR
jgi:hypothetical protein